MLDTALFVVFPYLAVAVAVGVGLYRYRAARFSYSSLSSQLLESRALFWGSVPWHYAILAILLAHLFAALLPGPWAALLGRPARLYVLEATGLALTATALVGLTLLVVRRARDRRVRVVTSAMDWCLLAALLVQVGLGFWVALGYRWGGLWYLHSVVPWLASLATFHPRPEFVQPLPLVVKLHIVGGFVVIGLFPFTRLVHLVTVPITYLWRPYQVVIWNRQPRQA